MTRFSITLEEGVNFVIKSMITMRGGELFVPKIPSFKILDLAKAVAPGVKTKIVGIRAGEKIHEEMITKSDSLNTFEFKDHYIILSNAVYHDNLELSSYKTKEYIKSVQAKGGKLLKKEFSYNSQTNPRFLSVEEIKKYIKKLELK